MASGSLRTVGGARDWRHAADLSKPEQPGLTATDKVLFYHGAQGGTSFETGTSVFRMLSEGMNDSVTQPTGSTVQRRIQSF